MKKRSRLLSWGPRKSLGASNWDSVLGASFPADNRRPSAQARCLVFILACSAIQLTPELVGGADGYIQSRNRIYFQFAVSGKLLGAGGCIGKTLIAWWGILVLYYVLRQACFGVDNVEGWITDMASRLPTYGKPLASASGSTPFALICGCLFLPDFFPIPDHHSLSFNAQNILYPSHPRCAARSGRVSFKALQGLQWVPKTRLFMDNRRHESLIIAPLANPIWRVTL